MGVPCFCGFEPIVVDFFLVRLNVPSRTLFVTHLDRVFVMLEVVCERK